MIGVVKLAFTAPVHIGEAGLGLEESGLIIHSDTLFSALFSVWLRLYHQPLPEKLRLSSAYPFYRDELFYPRPFLKLYGPPQEFFYDHAKTLNKLRFVSHDYFMKWIRGEPFSEREVEDMVSRSQCIESNINIVTRPQVVLDRLSNSSGLYFVGETWFGEGAGLYFFVDLPKHEWPRLKTVIELLGDEGIGGRRSLGYGTFQPKFIDNFTLSDASAPDAYITLSLYYPSTGELLPEDVVSYQLVERTGWIEGKDGNEQMRHQRVRMFTEGSVFRRCVQGTIVNVAPPGFTKHPVYRNGFAFTVGTRMGRDDNENL